MRRFLARRARAETRTTDDSIEPLIQEIAFLETSHFGLDGLTRLRIALGRRDFSGARDIARSLQRLRDPRDPRFNDVLDRVMDLRSEVRADLEVHKRAVDDALFGIEVPVHRFLVEKLPGKVAALRSLRLPIGRKDFQAWVRMALRHRGEADPEKANIFTFDDVVADATLIQVNHVLETVIFGAAGEDYLPPELTDALVAHVGAFQEAQDVQRRRADPSVSARAGSYLGASERFQQRRFDRATQKPKPRAELRKAPLIESRSWEVPLGKKRWVPFTVAPDNVNASVEEQIRDVIAKLDRLLAERNITKEDIFRQVISYGDIRDSEREKIKKALMEYFASGLAPPIATSTLEQSPAHKGKFVVEVNAVEGPKAEIIRVNENIVVVGDEDLFQVFIEGIRPDKEIFDAYDQTMDMFDKGYAALKAAEAKLKTLGKIPQDYVLDYRQVLRTWFYQNDILKQDPKTQFGARFLKPIRILEVLIGSLINGIRRIFGIKELYEFRLLNGGQRYQKLNDARYDYFTSSMPGNKAVPFGEGLIEGASQENPFWPASTGIGMLRGTMTMQALGFIPRHAGVRAVRLESATQMNPFEYTQKVLLAAEKGPSFWTRLVAFVTGNQFGPYKISARDLKGDFAQEILAGAGLREGWDQGILDPIRTKLARGRSVSKREWAKALNRLLAQAMLPEDYRAIQEGFGFDKETRALFEKVLAEEEADRSPLERAQLNRRILEAVYPRKIRKLHIKKSPPLWSRAMSLLVGSDQEGLPDYEMVMISGTASTRGQEVMHVGDPVKQTLFMIESVLLMITQRGGSLRDVPQLRVYIKRPGDYEEIKAAIDSKFPDIPITFSFSDVCRTNWLVEIEAFAFIPSKRGARPIAQRGTRFLQVIGKRAARIVLEKEKEKKKEKKTEAIAKLEESIRGFNALWAAVRASREVQKTTIGIDRARDTDAFAKAVWDARIVFDRVLQEQNQIVQTHPDNVRLVRQAFDVALHRHMIRWKKIPVERAELRAEPPTLPRRLSSPSSMMNGLRFGVLAGIVFVAGQMLEAGSWMFPSLIASNLFVFGFVGAFFGALIDGFQEQRELDKGGSRKEEDGQGRAEVRMEPTLGMLELRDDIIRELDLIAEEIPSLRGAAHDLGSDQIDTIRQIERSLDPLTPENTQKAWELAHASPFLGGLVSQIRQLANVVEERARSRAELREGKTPSALSRPATEDVFFTQFFEALVHTIKEDRGLDARRRARIKELLVEILSTKRGLKGRFATDVQLRAAVFREYSEQNTLKQFQGSFSEAVDALKVPSYWGRAFISTMAAVGGAILGLIWSTLLTPVFGLGPEVFASLAAAFAISSVIFILRGTAGPEAEYFLQFDHNRDLNYLKRMFRKTADRMIARPTAGESLVRQEPSKARMPSKPFFSIPLSIMLAAAFGLLLVYTGQWAAMSFHRGVFTFLSQRTFEVFSCFFALGMLLFWLLHLDIRIFGGEGKRLTYGASGSREAEISGRAGLGSSRPSGITEPLEASKTHGFPVTAPAREAVAGVSMTEPTELMGEFPPAGVKQTRGVQKLPSRPAFWEAAEVSVQTDHPGVFDVSDRPEFSDLKKIHYRVFLLDSLDRTITTRQQREQVTAWRDAVLDLIKRSISLKLSPEAKVLLREGVEFFKRSPRLLLFVDSTDVLVAFREGLPEDPANANNGFVLRPSFLNPDSRYVVSRDVQNGIRDPIAQQLRHFYINVSSENDTIVLSAGRAEVRKSSQQYMGEPLLEWINERKDGLLTADWQRLAVVGKVLMDLTPKEGISATADQVASEAIRILKGQGLATSGDAVRGFLDRWLQLGFVEKIETQGGASYRVAGSRREFAIKTAHIRSIRGELAEALDGLSRTGDPEPLEALIQEYTEAVDRWALYPVEARYPVLKAVSLLDRKRKKTLETFLAGSEALQSSALADAILLILQKKTSPNWLERHAPNLKGRTVYYISPETWLAAGGLGRVGQFHTIGAKKLMQAGAELVTIEPYYPYNVKRDVEGRETLERTVDYSKQPVPVEDLREVDQFTVRANRNGSRKDVRVQVLKGKNKFGIEVYLIKDVPESEGETEYYTKALYRYGPQHGAATWAEFTEFMSKASLKLVKRLEKQRKEKMQLTGERFESSVLWINDGQLGPLPVFKRIADTMEKLSAEERQRVVEDPGHPLHELKDLLLEEDRELSLSDAWIWAVTHTYRNRGIFDRAGGREFLYRMAIPGEWQGYFDRMEWYDSTSGMVRASDGGSGVAAVHAQEVQELDPESVLFGITNGDDRDATRNVFEGIFRELYPEGDSNGPEPEQLIAVKREAKKRLRDSGFLQRLDPEFAHLDPDKIVISYSGRLVDEKAGRKRAFTDENLARLVAQGAQVIIFGNVQGSEESRAMYRDLKALQARINTPAAPGRLIVATGWGIPEQRSVLAASDAVTFDSDRDGARGTEAAGFSEANGAATGAIVITSSFLEGLFQQQGEILNWDEPGSGNTVIPEDDRPESYRRVFMKALEVYQTNREKFASYQIVSIQESQALEAFPTAAEYLRQMDAMIARMEDPMKILLGYLVGNGRDAQHLRSEWVRQRLTEVLDELSSDPESGVVRFDSSNPSKIAVYLLPSETGYPARLLLVERGLRYGSEKIAAKAQGDFQTVAERLQIKRKSLVRVEDNFTREVYDTYPLEQLIREGLEVGVPGGLHAQVLNLVPVKRRAEVRENARQEDAPGKKNPFILHTIVPPAFLSNISREGFLAWIESVRRTLRSLRDKPADAEVMRELIGIRNAMAVMLQLRTNIPSETIMSHLRFVQTPANETARFAGLLLEILGQLRAALFASGSRVEDVSTPSSKPPARAEVRAGDKTRQLDPTVELMLILQEIEAIPFGPLGTALRDQTLELLDPLTEHGATLESRHRLLISGFKPHSFVNRDFVGDEFWPKTVDYLKSIFERLRVKYKAMGILNRDETYAQEIFRRLFDAWLTFEDVPGENYFEKLGGAENNKIATSLANLALLGSVKLPPEAEASFAQAALRANQIVREAIPGSVFEGSLRALAAPGSREEKIEALSRALRIALYASAPNIWFNDPGVQQDPVASAQRTRTLMSEALTKPLALNSTEVFFDENLVWRSRRLVYFVDDNGDLVYHLHLIRTFLEMNPYLRITVVGKGIRSESDATHADIAKVLEWPEFRLLKKELGGRFGMVREPPLYGGVNLLKASQELVDTILESHAVVVLGQMMGEEFNGVFKPAYLMSYVTGSYHQKVTGLNKGEMYFARTPPGKAAFHVFGSGPAKWTLADTLGGRGGFDAALGPRFPFSSDTTLRYGTTRKGERAEVRSSWLDRLLPRMLARAAESYIYWLSRDDSFRGLPDLLFVMGNPDLKTYDALFSQWHEIKRKHDKEIPILIVGGQGRGYPPLRDRIMAYFQKHHAASFENKHRPALEAITTEAGLIKYFLSNYGIVLKIPEEAITIEEDPSVNTLANFTHNTGLVAALVGGKKHPQIALVTAPHLLFRVQATAMKAWKGQGWEIKKWPTYKHQIRKLSLNELIEIVAYVSGYPRTILERMPGAEKLNRSSELKGSIPGPRPLNPNAVFRPGLLNPFIWGPWLATKIFFHLLLVRLFRQGRLGLNAKEGRLYVVDEQPIEARAEIRNADLGVTLPEPGEDPSQAFRQWFERGRDVLYLTDLFSQGAVQNYQFTVNGQEAFFIKLDYAAPRLTLILHPVFQSKLRLTEAQYVYEGEKAAPWIRMLIRYGEKIQIGVRSGGVPVTSQKEVLDDLKIFLIKALRAEVRHEGSEQARRRSIADWILEGYQGAYEERIMPLPEAVAAAEGLDERVLLLKPSTGHFSRELILEILERLFAFGYRAEEVRMLSGDAIRARNMMETHYGRIVEVAKRGYRVLNAVERGQVQRIFEKEFPDTEYRSVHVRGIFELPSAAWEAIDALWSSPETAAKRVKVGEGVFALPVEFPGQDDRFGVWQGKRIVLLNGFADGLVSSFEAPENRTVAIRIRGVFNADLRPKFAGATDPKQAEPGSIRGDAERGALTGFNGKVDNRANIIHLSDDGPENRRQEIALWFPPRAEIRVSQRKLLTDEVFTALQGFMLQEELAPRQRALNEHERRVWNFVTRVYFPDETGTLRTHNDLEPLKRKLSERMDQIRQEAQNLADTDPARAEGKGDFAAVLKKLLDRVGEFERTVSPARRQKDSRAEVREEYSNVDIEAFSKLAMTELIDELAGRRRIAPRLDEFLASARKPFLVFNEMRPAGIHAGVSVTGLHLRSESGPVVEIILRRADGSEGTLSFGGNEAVLFIARLAKAVQEAEDLQGMEETREMTFVFLLTLLIVSGHLKGRYSVFEKGTVLNLRHEIQDPSEAPQKKKLPIFALSSTVSAQTQSASFSFRGTPNGQKPLDFYTDILDPEPILTYLRFLHAKIHKQLYSLELTGPEINNLSGILGDLKAAIRAGRAEVRVKGDYSALAIGAGMAMIMAYPFFGIVAEQIREVGMKEFFTRTVEIAGGIPVFVWMIDPSVIFLGLAWIFLIIVMILPWLPDRTKPKGMGEEALKAAHDQRVEKALKRFGDKRAELRAAVAATEQRTPRIFRAVYEGTMIGINALFFSAVLAGIVLGFIVKGIGRLVAGMLRLILHKPAPGAFWSSDDGSSRESRSELRMHRWVWWVAGGSAAVAIGALTVTPSEKKEGAEKLPPEISSEVLQDLFLKRALTAEEIARIREALDRLAKRPFYVERGRVIRIPSRHYEDYAGHLPAMLSLLKQTAMAESISSADREGILAFLEDLKERDLIFSLTRPGARRGDWNWRRLYYLGREAAEAIQEVRRTVREREDAAGRAEVRNQRLTTIFHRFAQYPWMHYLWEHSKKTPYKGVSIHWEGRVAGNKPVANKIQIQFVPDLNSEARRKKVIEIANPLVGRPHITYTDGQSMGPGKMRVWTTETVMLEALHFEKMEINSLRPITVMISRDEDGKIGLKRQAMNERLVILVSSEAFYRMITAWELPMERGGANTVFIDFGPVVVMPRFGSEPHAVEGAQPGIAYHEQVRNDLKGFLAKEAVAGAVTLALRVEDILNAGARILEAGQEIEFVLDPFRRLVNVRARRSELRAGTVPENSEEPKRPRTDYAHPIPVLLGSMNAHMYTEVGGKFDPRSLGGQGRATFFVIAENATTEKIETALQDFFARIEGGLAALAEGVEGTRFFLMVSAGTMQTPPIPAQELVSKGAAEVMSKFQKAKDAPLRAETRISEIPTILGLAPNGAASIKEHRFFEWLLEQTRLSGPELENVSMTLIMREGFEPKTIEIETLRMPRETLDDLLPNVILGSDFDYNAIQVLEIVRRAETRDVPTVVPLSEQESGPERLRETVWTVIREYRAGILTLEEAKRILAQKVMDLEQVLRELGIELRSVEGAEPSLLAVKEDLSYYLQYLPVDADLPSRKDFEQARALLEQGLSRLDTDRVMRYMALGEMAPEDAAAVLSLILGLAVLNKHLHFEINSTSIPGFEKLFAEQMKRAGIRRGMLAAGQVNSRAAAFASADLIVTPSTTGMEDTPSVVLDRAGGRVFSIGRARDQVRPESTVIDPLMLLFESVVNDIFSKQGNQYRFRSIDAANQGLALAFQLMVQDAARQALQSAA
ncbi:MAG: ARMT1-like domain-containing protein [Candidatus Omnitrophota bacterium]